MRPWWVVLCLLAVPMAGCLGAGGTTFACDVAAATWDDRWLYWNMAYLAPFGSWNETSLEGPTLPFEHGQVQEWLGASRLLAVEAGLHLPVPPGERAPMVRLEPGPRYGAVLTGNWSDAEIEGAIDRFLLAATNATGNQTLAWARMALAGAQRWSDGAANVTAIDVHQLLPLDLENLFNTTRAVPHGRLGVAQGWTFTFQPAERMMVLDADGLLSVRGDGQVELERGWGSGTAWEERARSDVATLYEVLDRPVPPVLLKRGDCQEESTGWSWS